MTCVSNPKIYPLDYPPSIASSSLPGDPIVPGVEEIVDTLTYIQIQTRDTALRQANTRRIVGHQTIWNQNHLTGAVNLPISFAEMGKSTLPAPGVLGTVAFLAGGRSYGNPLSDMMAFYLGNESAAAVGMVLSEVRTYLSTCANDSSGFYMGGLNAIGMFTVIEELAFDKPNIARIAATLSVARFGSAGICNATQGVTLGGTVSDGVSTTQVADRISFDTKAVTALGNKLIASRIAGHNGTSNPTDGYIWGGASLWSAIPSARLFNIEGYNFQSQNCTTLGGSLSVCHLSHAAFGSPAVGYVAGGIAATVPGLPVTDIISRLPYDTLTISALGARMADPTVCVDGTQSSAAGYTLGGDITDFAGPARSNKLIFNTESAYPLGTALPGIYADRGAVCDYNPGR